MHIVIIEDDWQDREWLAECLTKHFPSSTISDFRTAGSFLLAVFRKLPPVIPIDIVITEHFLPLCQVRRDHGEWVENLKSLFPEVASNWDHQEAAERLVRHMRKNGVAVPVVIYTHGDRENIHADVLQDPGVTYCLKEAEATNIIQEIHRLMPVQT